MEALLIPIIVVLVLSLILRKGGIEVCSKWGFVIGRSWPKMFFGWVLLLIAVVLAVIIRLGIVADEAVRICTYVSIGLAIVSLLIFAAYYYNRLEITSDGFVYYPSLGKRKEFTVEDIERIKYNPSLGGLVLYTTKGKMHISGYYKDSWYIIEKLRGRNIKDFALTENGFYANHSRPFVFYKSYSQMMEQLEDNTDFAKLLKRALRHYNYSTIDNEENAEDMRCAIIAALKQLRIQGGIVSGGLEAAIKRFTRKHSEMLGEVKIFEVASLADEGKYDELYENALAEVGSANLYKRKDFTRVMYHLEMEMGCPPGDIFFSNPEGKSNDRLYALYPATGDRKYDILCSVGVGLHRMDAPKNIDYLSHCEISLAIPHGTSPFFAGNKGMMDLLTWLAHPENVGDYGIGNTFGDDEMTLFEGSPYNYVLILYMENGIQPFIGNGRKRINFYQIFPIYSGEARIWSETDDRIKLLEMMGYPYSSAEPDRGEVTEEMFNEIASDTEPEEE